MSSQHVALFVVGPPGVGKTAALRSLLPFYFDLHPKPKWTLAGRIALVGHYGSGSFDGGDTVPYNGGAAAVNFWRRNIVPRFPVAVFDGDRFSHQGAKAAIECVDGVVAACVHLSCNDETLSDRRSARKNTQNPSWMAGRATKAARFTALFDEQRRLHLDTSLLSIDEVGAELISFANDQASFGV
mgnify:CR=1 FL=1